MKIFKSKKISIYVASTLSLTFSCNVFAENDSPWLPIPGDIVFGINYTQQKADAAYIGTQELPISAITAGGAEEYKIDTTGLRFDYGICDTLALDAAISYTEVGVGIADNTTGINDSILGIRWQVLDEFIQLNTPSVTLRAAAIINGNYDGDRLAGIGKDANGLEISAIVGKQLNSRFSVWGEVGIQNRSNDVPNATFYAINSSFQFNSSWNASLGFSHKEYGGDLDIGGVGFTPERFDEVREERSLVQAGIGYAFANNQGLSLNVAQLNAGRNTIKDNSIVALSYNFSQ